jgi:NAD-dependent dihydropyrimidine dehydrogenase PreA subunit
MGHRKIIRINEELCDGCGECITACAEGALQLVDGKARLVNEAFCDGFGDCVGDCPTGAMVVEERDAEAFDFEATRAHVEREGGSEAVRKLEMAAVAHEQHVHGPAGRPAHGPAQGLRHGPTHGPARRRPDGPSHAFSHGPARGPVNTPADGPVQIPTGIRMAAPRPSGGGCPGTRMQFRPAGNDVRPVDGDGPKQAIPSELRQWPVQIHLVQPGAPFFENRELVIMNTCGPIASADVHWRFLRGRSVVVGCPKLDDTRPYAGKLAAILQDTSIPKATVVRMEVPCCGGLTEIAQEARSLSGREDLALEEVTVGVSGDILGAEPI